MQGHTRSGGRTWLAYLAYFVTLNPKADSVCAKYVLPVRIKYVLRTGVSLNCEGLTTLRVYQLSGGNEPGSLNR